MDLTTVAGVAVGLLLLGIAGYTAVWLSRTDDGPVLPYHYNPERYAHGGVARKPEKVGICDECGLWTDPDAGFCPICSGVVRGVPAER